MLQEKVCDKVLLLVKLLASPLGTLLGKGSVTDVLGILRNVWKWLLCQTDISNYLEKLDISHNIILIPETEFLKDIDKRLNNPRIVPFKLYLAWEHLDSTASGLNFELSAMSNTAQKMKIFSSCACGFGHFYWRNP